MAVLGLRMGLSCGRHSVMQMSATKVVQGSILLVIFSLMAVVKERASGWWLFPMGSS